MEVFFSKISGHTFLKLCRFKSVNAKCLPNENLSQFLAKQLHQQLFDDSTQRHSNHFVFHQLNFDCKTQQNSPPKYLPLSISADISLFEVKKVQEKARKKISLFDGFGEECRKNS